MIPEEHKLAATLVRTAFKTMCIDYNEVLRLDNFEPWTKDRQTIHESNQVHRFLECFRSLSKDSICWMELPVPFKGGKLKPELAHIDGFIVAPAIKSIFFIEAKRLSRPSQLESLKKDMDRIFDISHEIYVGDGQFKGINLFEYDSYAIALADIWSDKNEWTRNVAEDWKHTSGKLESIYSYVLDTDIHQILPNYFLTFTIQPIFCAEEYKKEVELESHKPGRASDPSILVWSDDAGFEALLASVNKGKQLKN